ncbi:MAG: hypothetical protein ACUVSY_12440, partial [Roseiflexus sp.]
MHNWHTPRHKPALALALIGTLLTMIVGVPFAIVRAQQVLQLTQIGPAPQGDVNSIITLTFQLTNNINDATAASPNTLFNITTTNVPAGVTVSSPGAIQLQNNNPGTTATFSLQLSIGSSAVLGTYNNLLVTAAGSYNSTSGLRNVSVNTFGTFVITVNGATATPTLSPTVT